LLKSTIDANLILCEKDEFKDGIVIIASHMSKGLEFDAVLIYNDDEENYKNENERKLFYTVCTRALHKLYIYFIKDISPILKEIDNNLYKGQRDVS
jgi:DNA helicase-2/ATP-dependent DNA helicase PcrA